MTDKKKQIEEMTTALHQGLKPLRENYDTETIVTILYDAGYRKHDECVEVVRCKDCMSWRGKDHDGVCIENGLATRMANEFCSRGEKKGRI